MEMASIRSFMVFILPCKLLISFSNGNQKVTKFTTMHEKNFHFKIILALKGSKTSQSRYRL